MRGSDITNDHIVRTENIKAPVFQLWMVMYSEGDFRKIDAEIIIGTYSYWAFAVVAKSTASVMLDKLHKKYTMEIRVVDESDSE